MIENLKYATISKIYIKKLIFYDKEKEKELMQMCLDYGITYLPSIDRQSCYRLIESKSTFEKVDLPEDLTCNPYDKLFDKTTLEKFESGNHDEVLFVTENGKIKGVVHIVDYNNDFINFEFFKATYHFEKMLRQLLVKKKENNDTLLDWMKEEPTNKNHWQRRYNQCVPKDEKQLENQRLKRRDCSPFQTFYLSDLLYFVKSKNYMSDEFNKHIESIKNIRNWVAHNKDLTHKTNGASRPLYKIKELKEFVKNANTFFNCYDELEEKILS